jgi:hypothetical protein
MIDLLVDAERRPLRPRARAARSRVCIGRPDCAFYYPWFGVTGDDAHWAQGGHDPPDDIASGYYPMAGLYSSDSASVVSQQMAEIARAGIDQIAVSWWGRGSPEDLRLPEVIAAASVLHISVAIHIEPYNGRTVDSVVGDVDALHALGITTFYVYQAFDDPPAEWAPANDRLRAEGATMFAETALAGQAAAGHFTGLYTYDIVTYGGGKLARLCNQAHAVGLLCAPSVGPGTTRDGERATPTSSPSARTTYDSMASARRRCRRHHDHLVQRVAGGHADRARRPADPPRRVLLRPRRRLNLWARCRNGCSTAPPTGRTCSARPAPKRLTLAYSSACGSSRAHRVRAVARS